LETSTPIPLQSLDLNLYSDAKCMDVTPSGYYYEKFKEEETAQKWVFYLEGGGECDTESGCKAQLSGSLGSSLYFSQEKSDSTGWYLASSDCHINGDFCNWNHVDVTYCSQDLHSGQVTTPSDNTWGLYFSGHLIFQSILDDLVA
jgi:hypothetical protein